VKLSVILPTRNGGRFLRDCISAVLADPDPELELVLADNANDDGTPAILHQFGHDPRLKVVRQDHPVPVTENWRSALMAGTGDYMVMIGDDDYYLPGYASRIRALVSEHQYPDCVTYNAFSYVFPSAIDGLDVSHYMDSHFAFGKSFKPYQLLGRELQRSIVKEMFRFRPLIPLNMQTTLISRKAVESVRGELFREPFPDHYALNALLLTVDRWLYVPERLLVIGMSRKSFGHFIYSHHEGEGLRYLGIDTAFEHRLPGNELLTAMYMWLLLLKREFPEELVGTEVSRAHYVVRQMWAWYVQWRFGSLSGSEVMARLRLLSWRDCARMSRLATDRHLLEALATRVRLDRSDRAQHLWYGLRPLPHVNTIAEFGEWLQQRGINS